MSWATVVGSKSSKEDRGASEESQLQMLHELYNEAMQSMSNSIEVCDEDYTNAVQKLGMVVSNAHEFIKHHPSAYSIGKCKEISYLANVNRVECLSKNATFPLQDLYCIALTAAEEMEGLEKFDSSLMLMVIKIGI